MSQNFTRTKGRPPIGGAGLTLHRTLEILLAHRGGAVMRDVDPVLDLEQARAMADLVAYYFGEAERTRLQSAGVGPRSRRLSRPVIIEEIADAGC